MQIMNFSIVFFVLTGALFAVTALIMGLWLVVKTQLLYAHLKKTNYQRWADITTLDAIWGKIGPGAVSPSRFLAYLKSGLDDEDQEVMRYKNSLRMALRYMGIFFAASFFTLVIALALSLYGN